MVTPFFGLISLRLRASASSRMQDRALARLAVQKATAPAGGRERKGEATAFRAWCGRAAGYPGDKGGGSLATFSGEPIFDGEKWVRQEFGENRGDRKPGGRALASGVAARDARKRKAVAGRFRADARQGESNGRSCSNEEFAELRRSDTEVGGGVPEGERLRWDG